MRCLVVSNITDQEKNESEHGTDIIAYKFHNEEKTPTKEDELVAIEVKAKLSLKEICGVIQNAAADSTKDEYRVAHTLNYYRKSFAIWEKSRNRAILNVFSKSRIAL